MNLEELRSVQRAERQKDSLQHLRDSFYTDVAEYIAQLKDERERAVSDKGPYHSDVRQLTDKIESATEVANALYERRVGKVVKHASFAAADMAADEEGMTAEERELFEDLVARIRQNRETVLATLEGAHESELDPATDSPDEGQRGNSEPPAATGADANAADDAAAADDLLADALGETSTAAATDSTTDQPAESTTDTPSTETTDGGASDDDRPVAEAAAATPSNQPDSQESTDTDTHEQSSSGTDRTMVRITADVGTVYGVDEREYDLAREDVIDLPTTNAEPLLQKNAAERID